MLNKFFVYIIFKIFDGESMKILRGNFERNTKNNFCRSFGSLKEILGKV